jgi:hypothetical protein
MRERYSPLPGDDTPMFVQEKPICPSTIDACRNKVKTKMK